MKKFLIFPFLLALMLVSCHQDVSDEGSLPPASGLTGKMTENYKENQNPYDAGQSVQIPEKVVIKVAELTIEVKDLDNIKKQLDSLLKQYGAYIQQERLDNYSSGINDYIEIRVRATGFDSLLSGIKQLGKLTYLSISSRDVTANVIDIQARLDTKLKVAQQYKQLLKRCSTVSEVMEVTEALRRVQEEIESMQARLKYYHSQASYSTIKLTLVEHEPVYKQISFWQSLREAFWVSWQVFGYFVVVIVASLPFWLVALIIYLVVRKLRKKRNVKSK